MGSLARATWFAGATALATVAACTLLELPSRSSLVTPGLLTVASGLSGPQGLAVDDTYVYWSDSTGVHAVSKVDGTGRLDLSTSSSVGEVAANASGAYWVDAPGGDAGLVLRATDGATQRVNIPGGTRGDHIAASGQLAFATSGAAPEVYVVDASGGGLGLSPLGWGDAMVPEPASIVIATDGQRGAWVSEKGVDLCFFGVGPDVPTRTVAMASPITRVAVASSSPFVLGRDAAVYQVPPPGGGLARTVGQFLGSTGLAATPADAGASAMSACAYWFAAGGLTRGCTGGSAVLLVSDTSLTAGATLLVADADRALYWIRTAVDGGAASGRILKLSPQND